MKNNNNIGQELSEFKPVELVGCKDEEAGSPRPFRGWVVHLLTKYKNNFPENCFYTGPVYRKMEKGSNCPQELVACSCEMGANDRVGLFSITHPRYYQSTCVNGYYLHNIVLYLMDMFNLQEPKRLGMSLLKRTREEAEVICYMERKNFKKQNKERKLPQ